MVLCDTRKHHFPGNIAYNDPGTIAGVWGSICTWILGYPDRAMRMSDEKDAHARRHGHPFNLGVAVSVGGHIFDPHWKLEDLYERAEECERLGRENSLPVLWAIVAPISYGLALIREGKVAAGIARLKAAHCVLGSGWRQGRRPELESVLGRRHGADWRPRRCADRRADYPDRAPRMGGTPSLRRNP